MFADVKDDDDDEFEIVPVKPSQTADDFSDGLCCMSVFSASIITGIIARWTNADIESTQRLILGFFVPQEWQCMLIKVKFGMVE